MSFLNDLRKIIVCIKKDWVSLAWALFVGQSATWLGIPYLLSKAAVKEILSLNVSPAFVLLASSLLLILLVAFKPAVSFYRRYLNNYRLSEVFLTYVDIIALGFLSLLLSFVFFRSRLLANIVISKEISLFTWSLLISLLLWGGAVVLTVRRGRKSFTYPSMASVRQVQGSGCFADEPIKSDSADLLERVPFVEALHEQVKGFSFPEPFVFGLYGRWGEGKSSILNLLKNRLFQDDNLIVFEFDPWYYASRDSIFKGFYDGLYTALNRNFFFPNFRKPLAKYQKILSSSLDLYSLKLNVTPGDQAIEEVRDQIQHYVNSVGRKIVVIIDDIDRLQSKEDILQIFRIVKLSGSFNNTIFILSLDPILVKSLLGTDDSFMDKIIQNPIQLPAIDQRKLDRIFLYSFPDENHFSMMDRLLQKLDIGKERIKVFDEKFPPFYEEYFKKQLQTLRSIIRYMNGLSSTLPPVKNEVNIFDFVVLEAIRIYYPVIYEDIRANSHFYIELHELLTLGTERDESEKLKVKTHIDNIIRGNENALPFLKEIFSKVSNAYDNWHRHSYGEERRADKRIDHEEVFPKYFMRCVPSGTVSDYEIEAVIANWNDLPDQIGMKFVGLIRTFRDRKLLLQLLDRFAAFRGRFNENASREMVRAMCININLFSAENEWRSERKIVQSLLVFLLERKIAHNLQAFLNEMMDITPSHSFAVDLYDSCSNKQFAIYNKINIDELRMKLCTRLCHYFIEGNRNIFEEEPKSYGRVLYQWIVLCKDDREGIRDYVFSYIDKKPEILCRLILGFMSFEMIEYDALISVYDETRLIAAVTNNRARLDCNEKEKAAIDTFVNTYNDKHPQSEEPHTKQE